MPEHNNRSKSVSLWEMRKVETIEEFYQRKFEGEPENIRSEIGHFKHSLLLSAWLTVVGVPNELIIVKDAPHFGVMFDADEIRNKVMNFLKKELN